MGSFLAHLTMGCLLMDKDNGPLEPIKACARRLAHALPSGPLNDRGPQVAPSRRAQEGVAEIEFAAVRLAHGPV